MVFLFRGSVILGFGWQPLLLNALLYLILGIILLVDSQNTIKPMAMIPFIGLIGSFVAFLPIIGMFYALGTLFLNGILYICCTQRTTYIQIKILKLFILNTKMIKTINNFNIKKSPGHKVLG